MTHYEERRVFPYGAIRQLCIDREWYTGGDAYDYQKMQERAEHARHVDTDVIIAAAKDIKDHSILPEDYGVCEIAYELCRITRSVFVQHDEQ